MSARRASALGKERTIRDVLYEEPGPRTRRVMHVGTVVSAVLVALLVVAVVRQFAVTGQLAGSYWDFFLWSSTWTFLGSGLLGTVRVALTAGVIALVLGLLLMLGRISANRALSAVCRVLTEFLRGVPSLLMIYFFFLIVPQYGIKMSSFWMVTLPISLTAAGVLAEVFRAGVNAVPKGQVEAALALGMRPFRVTLKIVLPQAVRIVIPTMISQLVVVVKDTTVAYVVSYPDLLQNARVLIVSHDALVSVYFVIAIIYILINVGIHKLSLFVSRRMGVKIIE